jgi:hypothetical protein
MVLVGRLIIAEGRNARRTFSNQAMQSSSRMFGVSGSKSDGEHLALRGDMCAMLAGASGSD